jgi:hypothetical protein
MTCRAKLCRRSAMPARRAGEHPQRESSSMRTMNRSLVVAGALVLLVCCTKSRRAPISPDDPHYCDHCPCRPGPVTCPGEQPSLCTLSGLWDSQRPMWAPVDAGYRIPSSLITRAWNCGKYVVVDELCGADCGGTYAYDASTGRIAASREGGGISWLHCDDRYESNWWTQPPGFIFPDREACSPLDVRELALSDAGPEPIPK